MRERTRQSDSVGRWGGEEFLVLCPQTGLSQAEIGAERIRDAVGGRDFGLGHRLSLSAGVAELRPDDTPDSLLQRADEALYRAKRSGRDRVCVAP
ncbi:MAG: hypothetical protein BSR46_13040 [Candidatus Dactylopiibacterium carminicum]|nr:MAG: hypothetical protein BSR46_13040 [Candidatus Dactylopiibacterium carminicum]